MLSLILLSATASANLPMAPAWQGPLSVSDFVALAWRDDGDLQVSPEHQKQIDGDVKQGEKYSVEVEKELKLSTNKNYIDRVERIGSELAEIANKTHPKVLWGDKQFTPLNYHFKVVQGTDVNAFSLPGGYLYFYEGLLKYAESDDELAGVIAHEMSHAAFRHVATLQREASKMGIWQIPLLIAAIAKGGSQGAQIAISSQMAGQAFVSGWSQQAELAADFGAFQYIEKSKYNPSGLVTLMERLAAQARMNPIDLGIYQTHPPSRERADALIKDLREAGVQLRRSQVSTSLSVQLKPGDNGVVEAWFAGKKIYSFAGSESLTRADQAVTRLNAFYDQVPQLYDLEIDGDVVKGRGKVLFTIMDADAKAIGTDVDDLAAQTRKSLQGSLFTLAFRVWAQA